jgi:hypothetical protein
MYRQLKIHMAFLILILKVDFLRKQKIIIIQAINNRNFSYRRQLILQ